MRHRPVDSAKAKEMRQMNINKINPATLKITDMRFADIDGRYSHTPLAVHRGGCHVSALSDV